MTSFQITSLLDASILAIYAMRDQIYINPDYQRPGGVWNLKKKQLFIDSLLNKYDIPKLYFHQIVGSNESEEHRYAIIDGKQRLETIWHFIDGSFPLADGFEYFEDPDVTAEGMTYQDLSKNYPTLVTRLNSRSLTVMIVAVDELDVVEDMFSRLNEAVPLNAAEKRNAFGGPLPLITRRLVKHQFFKTRIAVSSNRYRHHDLAAKFLYLENSDDIVDTKTASLDAFFHTAREEAKDQFQDVENSVNQNLDSMKEIFVDNDDLLKSAGMVVVYYVLLSRLRRDGIDADISRARLAKFEKLRACNRKKFENDLNEVDRRLIEFDELARSSNDGAAIRERYRILHKHLTGQFPGH